MNTIDEYLVHVPPSQKAALERIRHIVKQLVPDAEESISYGMPTFKYKKKALIHFGAFKDHMSIFPTADPRVDAIGASLAKFRTSKGTLQFTEANPIPDQLIEEIIATRLESLSLL